MDSVILCDSQEDAQVETESLSLLQGRKGDGLVIAPVGQSARHLEGLQKGNLIALGALRALTEEGLRVPDDVSIICFDDQPYCAYLNPPLTTVSQNNEQMGQIAVRLLLDHIQSAQGLTSDGIVLPTRLIQRASVRSIRD